MLHAGAVPQETQAGLPFMRLKPVFGATLSTSEEHNLDSNNTVAMIKVFNLNCSLFLFSFLVFLPQR